MTDMTADVATFLAEWTAAEEGRDGDRLSGLIADDFTAIGPLGFFLSKRDWLNRHVSGDLTYQKFRVNDTRVRQFGEVAVVTATHDAIGAYQGNPIPSTLRMTLVLIAGVAGLRLHHAQMSFVAGTPGAPSSPGRPRPT